MCVLLVGERSDEFWSMEGTYAMMSSSPSDASAGTVVSAGASCSNSAACARRRHFRWRTMHEQHCWRGWGSVTCTAAPAPLAGSRSRRAQPTVGTVRPGPAGLGREDCRCPRPVSASNCAGDLVARAIIAVAGRGCARRSARHEPPWPLRGLALLSRYHCGSRGTGSPATTFQPRLARPLSRHTTHELVPRARMVVLVGDVVRLDELRKTKPGAVPLLGEVRKFHEASMRGDYYESFAVNSKNFMGMSEGTEAFMAEFDRLVGKCIRQ